MPKTTPDQLNVFLQEHKFLYHTPNISVKEQLVIFISIVAQRLSNYQVQDWFQHSGETISRYFKLIQVSALVILHNELIILLSINKIP